MHQAYSFTSWGTFPLELLISPFAIISERQAWYHPDKTDPFLNLLAVGVPLCTELATLVMSWRVTHALSNRIEMTALAILIYASSENNSGGTGTGRGASAGF